MNEDVVIIGCGFMGKIKAQIWCALGMNVYVYDVDKEKENALIQTNIHILSYESYSKNKNPRFVDIATPNTKHGDALAWVLRHMPHTQVILVEKPICSTEQERFLIEKTLALFPKASVFVNETYYWSEALAWLVDRLKIQNEKPEVITINLSKNRLVDVASGRFFDKELQAYGIEIPHSVAILQRLGIDIIGSTVKQNIQYKNDIAGTDVNQGVHVELLSSNGTIAHLDSFLGDYFVKNETITPNSLIRSVVVETLGERYKIEFDPVEGVARYTSRITIESTAEVVHIEDNHLMNHMRHIRNNTVNNTIAKLLSPQNSFDIFSFLSTLARTAQVRKPSGMENNFVMGREKD